MRQDYKIVDLMVLEITTVSILKMLELSVQVSIYNYFYPMCTFCVFVDTSAPVTVSVRVQGGNQPYNGRVEVMYNGEWGTICSDGWDINDAITFCRQLGFVDAVATGEVANFSYSRGTGRIWQTNVDCTSQERRFGECFFPETWGDIGSCDHSMDVAVQCSR